MQKLQTLKEAAMVEAVSRLEKMEELINEHWSGLFEYYLNLSEAPVKMPSDMEYERLYDYKYSAVDFVTKKIGEPPNNECWNILFADTSCGPHSSSLGAVGGQRFTGLELLIIQQTRETTISQEQKMEMEEYLNNYSGGKRGKGLFTATRKNVLKNEIKEKEKKNDISLR